MPKEGLKLLSSFHIIFNFFKYFLFILEVLTLRDFDLKFSFLEKSFFHTKNLKTLFFPLIYLKTFRSFQKSFIFQNKPPNQQQLSNFTLSPLKYSFNKILKKFLKYEKLLTFHKAETFSDWRHYQAINSYSRFKFKATVLCIMSSLMTVK